MAAVAPIRDIDRGWTDLLKRLAKGTTDVTVGLHAQDGGVQKKAAGGMPESESTLIDVAAAHEFGLGVPRRSFIADWQDQNAALHQKQIEAMAKAIVRGTVPSAEVAAERLANLWVGEVQKRIVAGISPPLKKRTIDRKKSSTPLIDTGQLRSSIAYAVNGKLRPSKAFEQATREQIKADKKAEKAVARERKKAVEAAKKAINSALRDLKKRTSRSTKALAKVASKATKVATKRAKVVAKRTSRVVTKASSKAFKAAKKRLKKRTRMKRKPKP